MPNEDKDKDRSIFMVRKFPIILGIAAGIFFNSVSNDSSVILKNLGGLMITVSVFLLFVTLFNNYKLLYREQFSDENEETKLDNPKDRPMDSAGSGTRLNTQNNSALENDIVVDEWDKCFTPEMKPLDKIKAFFAQRFRDPERNKVFINEPEEKPSETPDNTAVPDTQKAPQDDLIEIFKYDVFSKNQAHEKTIKDKNELYASILYVIIVTFGLIWSLFMTFAVMPLAFNEYYNYGFIDAILLLIFSCITVIYLRMRKDEGTRPADKTSHGILTVLLYASIVYAAFIAADSVLDINILVVLPWINFAISLYLITAITINILLSVMKHNVLGDFNYTLIFHTHMTTGKDVGVMDSDDIKSNFSFKSLWTIKYAIRIFPGLILALGFILILSTSIFVVQPHQQAAVYQLGKLGKDSIVGEGLHFKLPWPFEKADIYDVKSAKLMQIGYLSSNTTDFLWNQTHDGGEYTLLLGSGNEVVSVNIKIVYYIEDLYTYIKTFSVPEVILSAAAYETLMERTVNTTLDAFLSIDRSSLSKSLSNQLSEFCKSEGLGLSVIEVIIESIHPPVDVADVYQKVVTASIDKNTIITKAMTDAQVYLNYAEQQSITVVDYALAEQYRRVSDAQNQMAVYYAEMEAYSINPECFKLTKYLKAYETIIKGNKVYVFSPGLKEDISSFIIGKSPVILPNEITGERYE